MSTVTMKRLTRPDTPSHNFRLTKRDVIIISAVRRWRFMTSQQVVGYLTSLDSSTSRQHVLRRLCLLFYYRYLDRPAQQHLQLSTFGHLVYGLGKEGARLLADADASIAPHLDWSAKNARASTPHLMHGIETTSAMLSFDTACRERGLRLLDHHDLLPLFPDSTRELDDPFRLRVTIEHDRRQLPLNVVPDRLFAIVLPDNRPYNFALEVDRGTMSVAARRLTGKSSFARKIRSFLAAWEQDRHVAQWNMRGFRVLSVVPSEKRIETMLRLQGEITENRLSALFLYTTPTRMQAEGALAPIWMSATSDRVSLIESA
jgi:hypothetical protein